MTGRGLLCARAVVPAKITDLLFLRRHLIIFAPIHAAFDTLPHSAASASSFRPPFQYPVASSTRHKNNDTFLS